MNVDVKFVGNTTSILPTYAKEGDAGLDIFASLEKPIFLYPGKPALISTGIAVALPESRDPKAYVWQLEIRPRSGLALKQGVGVPNSPGTIDAGYRGEIKVILCVLGDSAVQISPGDRVAQMVLTKAYRVTWQLVDELPETERGAGSFGSTGK